MPELMFFLGSHPELSLLEIESLLGKRIAIQYSPTSPAVALAKEGPLPLEFFDRLGGIDRVGIILGKQTSQYSPEQIVALLSPLPRKWMLGLNADESLAFEIKKLAHKQGSKINFVLPKGKHTRLNAAQVIFNKLDQAPNAEINLVQKAQEWLAVKTIWIQDIRAYEIRDTSRPAKFGKVGLLPPKLAQIMINLAVGNSPSATILDPFCGMGTILQEGQLMGYKMLGSDSEPKMIEAARQNLQWLTEHFQVSGDPNPEVFKHDAREAFGPEFTGKFDAVVTEPDLGPPLRSPLSSYPKQLTDLYLMAFRNFREVLKPDGKVVFVFPAYAKASARRSLPMQERDFTFISQATLDDMAKLGYRQIQPLEPGKRLLYARPDAWVGREITIWHIKRPPGQHN